MPLVAYKFFTCKLQLLINTTPSDILMAIIVVQVQIFLYRLSITIYKFNCQLCSKYSMERYFSAAKENIGENRYHAPGLVSSM